MAQPSGNLVITMELLSEGYTTLDLGIQHFKQDFGQDFTQVSSFLLDFEYFSYTIDRVGSWEEDDLPFTNVCPPRRILWGSPNRWQ